MVLDAADLTALREHNAITSPDGKLLIGFSPDLAWTAAAFHEAMETPAGLTPQKILAILATSIAKPVPE